MALIDLQNLILGFGGHPLFEGINLQLEEGERCCLVGRNGAGKSTLLKVIAGEIMPDSGTVARKQGLKVAWVPQDIPDGMLGSVREILETGLMSPRRESNGGRDEVARTLSRMELDGAADFSKLSGGMKRRVLLGRALVMDPDILLLDEPTNHLDVDSIIWLENFLLRESIGLLFITHDRTFARRIASRVCEIAAGKIQNYNCSYDTFLERREAVIAADERHQEEFQKKLAEEEAWIRRGIKARRTRDEGRVRALKEMRAVWADRRTKLGTARLSMGQSVRSGDLVIEAKDLSYAWPGGTCMVDQFSTTILRGDKIGLIGPNGSGKTTFIRLLLGELSPDSGSVRVGSNLQIVYFDQLRNQLDPQLSVKENLAGADDAVLVNGKSRHVLAYLQDFLFSPDRARSPVHILSGGERNRLLLAKLFMQPSNLLVMDEPTNDLDAETLELLEDLLVEYRGTLLLVSHDRAFLDEVVTSTIVFEGTGKLGEFAGGYADWLLQKKTVETNRIAEARKEKSISLMETGTKTRKLNFKEQRELGELPDRIAALETEQHTIQQKLSDPELYRQGGGAVVELNRQLEKLNHELAAAYARWEELESLA